ncbi:unnamed protein product [Linum tenue]|uniref:Uncharacterized protein n=1 Tax=Linum tenue TaxID=586396 RepID=A0AAV0HK70_9ROSI|nr:unnamed protein product [Linum tenue]
MLPSRFFDGAGTGESDDDDGEVAGDFPFFPPEVEFDDFDGDGALVGDFFSEAPLDGALAGAFDSAFSDVLSSSSSPSSFNFFCMGRSDGGGGESGSSKSHGFKDPASATTTVPRSAGSSISPAATARVSAAVASAPRSASNDMNGARPAGALFVSFCPACVFRVIRPPG